MEEEAQRHADRAGGHADVDELQREQAEDVPLRQPEAAHHRAGVEVAVQQLPLRRRERAVGGQIQPFPVGLVLHDASRPQPSSASAVLSIWRARKSLFLTVPSGMPLVRAISS